MIVLSTQNEQPQVDSPGHDQKGPEFISLHQSFNKII